jgi:hypothetical protein
MAGDAHLRQRFTYVPGKVKRLRIAVTDDATGQPVDLSAVPLRCALVDATTERRAEVSSGEGAITVAGATNTALVIFDSTKTGVFRGLAATQQTWLLWQDQPTPTDDPLAGGYAQGLDLA